jgi:hypothetical protein
MSRIKSVLLGLAALLVMSAIASGPASATVKKEYFEGGTTKAIASETIEGVVGVADLQSEISGTKVLITCTSNTLANAKIESGGKSEGEIKYTECGKLFQLKEGKKTELGNCPVEVPAFKFKDKLIEGTKSGVVEDEFEPASGKLFVEVIIKSTGTGCTFGSEAGKKYNTEGTYIASLGQEAEMAKKEGEIKFDSTGSNVTFEKQKAAYTNTVTKVKLSGTKAGQEWYVD